VLWLAVATGTADAGPLEMELGPAAVVFDTPNVPRGTIGAAALTATFHADPQLPIGLRLHMSVGSEAAGMHVLGFAFRQRRSNLVIDTGIGVADIVGVSTTMDSQRASGLGLALDLRIGYAVGPVTISAFALPACVLASDGVSPEAKLRSAVEVGITVGKSL